MIAVSYTINGIDDVRRMFAMLRADALKGELADLMDQIAGDAADYPASPAGSTYERSGALGRGWTDGQTIYPQSGATVLEAVRQNSTAYGPFVQGAEDQAQIHQGRWRTTDALMDAWEDRAAAMVEDALTRLAAR